MVSLNVSTFGQHITEPRGLFSNRLAGYVSAVFLGTSLNVADWLFRVGCGAAASCAAPNLK